VLAWCNRVRVRGSTQEGVVCRVIERKERWQETHDREKAEIGRKEK
jgi:hypothetical protein